MSTCIYSIVASKLGMYDNAYEYFGDSALLDLFNTHKNTKDGIYTADMACQTLINMILGNEVEQIVKVTPVFVEGNTIKN